MNTTSSAMHEPTNPLAESPDTPMRRWAEAARMAPSQAPGRDMPGPIERPSSLAYIRDVVCVLTAKRERYKGVGEIAKAATVDECIKTLKRAFA